MVPFPFNENQFSFFFCCCCRPSTSWPVVYKSKERQEPSIMPKSDTMFNEQDRRCAAVQLMHSTDPSYDNRSIDRTLKMQMWITTNNRDVPRAIKIKFSATVIVIGVVSSEGHIMPPLIFEVCLKVNTKVYLDVLKSLVIPLVIRWPVADPGCRSRTCRRPTSPKRPRLGFRRSATTLYPSLTPPPRPESAGLLCFVIRREHHQHDLPQHQSQLYCCHPPSICRAPAGACGKGMLSISDPYRGGVWGWRRLHWLDVSS